MLKRYIIICITFSNKTRYIQFCFLKLLKSNIPEILQKNSKKTCKENIMNTCIMQY